MDPELEKDLKALAEKYKNDMGDGGVVAAILYTILGSLAMGGDVIYLLAKICVEFSKSMLAKMEYNEWVEKG